MRGVRLWSKGFMPVSRMGIREKKEKKTKENNKKPEKKEECGNRGGNRREETMNQPFCCPFLHIPDLLQSN